MEHKHTNNLINSTSPYLLQHAHNPVNWNPWCAEIIEQAKAEDKLLLVSIGYAACHWCHVMEHESFEDVQVAKIMNDNFVCVKVDREERPDVDHYYMTAVHLLGQQGGWPLNVIAMPDGRPIWGGTYFPKMTWMKNLMAVADFYRQNRSQTEEYAVSLQNGIEQASLVSTVINEMPVNLQILENGVNNWKQTFDMENGGRKGAPKFPMPVNLDFLLYYGAIKKDETVLQYVNTTLLKMARGGIYDQIGGGFARYSVDEIWKVPHFEKMLYDNGQLLSIYSKAFRQFGDDEFKNVVYQTVDFIERELRDPSGAYYSSLDADSEGEEGKFYVWNVPELKSILSSEFELFSRYFNVNKKGFWEKGNSILLRDSADEDFARENGLTPEQLRIKLSEWKKLLLAVRSKRVRPGLDDKTLTSWNALVIQGLVDAFISFNDKRFLNLALQNAEFIQREMIHTDGRIFHNWKLGKKSIDGFLEDYALVIQAFISLFQITGNEHWLRISEKLTNYCFLQFYNDESGLFYFTEKNNISVITNHFQMDDNVIPAANSVMANNLHKLYLILGKSEYKSVVFKMLVPVTPQFSRYPMAYANWGNIMLKNTAPYFEVAILGSNAETVTRELQTGFHPDIMFVFSRSESEIPILKNRMVQGKTLIYVCKEGVCQLPVETAKQAFEILN
ncbi:MAG: thioredoxin domain-containing protein [Bacteroidetes bacterium]|nr:MAG: thioredoxin domain-containing protein [Bacteroidota bacterium]